MTGHGQTARRSYFALGGEVTGEVEDEVGGVGGEGSPKGQRDRGGIGSRPKSATKLRALHAAGNKFFHQSLKLFTGARDDHFAGFRPASCPPFFAYADFVHPNLLADRDQFW